MERALSGALGDALVAALDWTWPRLCPRVRTVLESLGEAVLPDPPMTIRTLDGDIVTGFLFVDRGQVVAFIGSRRPAPSPFPRWEHEGLGDERPGFRGRYPR